MRDYDDGLSVYEEDAEMHYDDYDEDDFGTGYEGNEDSYYEMITCSIWFSFLIYIHVFKVRIFRNLFFGQ